MDPLKEMFNAAFYQQLARQLVKSYPSFDDKKFLEDVTGPLATLSLNERMRHTSQVMHRYLPDNYKKTISILKETIPHVKTGYTNLLFPDYVSQFGMNDFKTSIDALHYFTSFGSSEFAIRVFLKQDIEKTLPVMYRWSQDKNEHVRRLASEGSRPRLPWSFKLESIIQQPRLTEPILQNLKQDDSLYVRKSVANHLNDIAKDSPEYVLKLVKSWDTAHPHTAWIVKRGCRSLLKQGNRKSMTLFNFTKNAQVSIKNFSLSSSRLKLNDSLTFTFDILSEKSSIQRLMVDYKIYYAKKSGQQLPKVFKLKEVELKPGEKITLNKKQRFQDFTTRKLHSGEHIIELIVNGKPMKRAKFIVNR
jgi:3-methyladenine DNA glycosylase AlkC